MAYFHAVMTSSDENEGMYDFLKKGSAKLENTYKLGWNIFIWGDFDDFKTGVKRSFLSFSQF